MTPTPQPPPSPEPAVVVPPAAAWPEPPPVFDAGAALNSSAAGAVTSGDTTRPRVSVRSLTNHRLAVVLRRGLAFSVGCSEACRIQARAVVDARTARRLGVGGIVARTSTVLARPDRARVIMRLSRRARTKLKPMQSVRLRVTITVTDRANNTTLVARTVRTKR